MPRRSDGVCPHGWQRSACARCRGKNNRTKGQAVQREMHRELGGTGWTPQHEESGRGYDIETVAVKVHPEAKGGNQIPKSVAAFLATDWYRRAMSQSARSVPFGSGAKPALWMHLPGGRKLLIVDYGGGRGKTTEGED